MSPIWGLNGLKCWNWNNGNEIIFNIFAHPGTGHFSYGPCPPASFAHVTNHFQTLLSCDIFSKFLIIFISPINFIHWQGKIARYLGMPWSIYSPKLHLWKGQHSKFICHNFVVCYHAYKLILYEISDYYCRFSELSLTGIRLNKLILDQLCKLANTTSLSGLFLGATSIGTVSFLSPFSLSLVWFMFLVKASVFLQD